MHDPLSILDAARECGERPALILGDQTLTFSAIAERVRHRIGTLAQREPRSGPCPLIADNTLDSVVLLYALLEQRVPALVIDARLTPIERDVLIADASAAGAARYPDAAAIVHTSGTSGKPRGAVLSRSAFIASAAASAANLGWRDDDCWLACMPIARVGGLSILTRSLIARRAVALEQRFDVDRVPDCIERHRATLVSLVPTMLARLLDAHAGWRAPTQLRAVLVGGAAASASLLRRARERRVPIVVTYGLTESCSQVVATPYERRFEADACGAGNALQGSEVRVVDGRIEVRGPMLMSGYWNEPRRSPDAWLDTADVGEVDANGFLHILGRRADVIVTGGDNVYPAEVERVLEDHPDLEAAAVFGVADETWGQTVAVALVAKRTAPADIDLHGWIGARLAAHKRPRQVCFVERLPQTPQGKLDRAALQRFERSLRPLNTRVVLHR